MPPKRSNIGRRTRRANRDQESRANESDEQTASRLDQVRLATNTRRSAQSPADRESRLAASRDRTSRKVTNRRTSLTANIGIARYDEISETELQEHYCEAMNIICTSCGSMIFISERTGKTAREMEKFTHCREKGKLKLPDIKIPSQI